VAVKNVGSGRLDKKRAMALARLVSNIARPQSNEQNSKTLWQTHDLFYNFVGDTLD